MNISTIRSGDLVEVGYRRWLSSCEFLGFGTDRETPTFGSLREIRSQVADREAHLAIFRSTEDGGTWAAYYWRGRWRVGSSADTIKFG